MLSLRERAKKEGTPLLETSARETRATFVWRGKNPPYLTGDFVYWAADGGGSPNPPLTLEEVAPNVWARTLTFPNDAYVEYV